MKKLLAALCGLFALLSVQSHALADTPTTEPSSISSDLSSSTELFPQGLWTTTMYGGYAEQFGHHREQMGEVTLGLGYYLFKNFSLNGEIIGTGISQSGGGAAVGGVSLLLRHHLYNGNNWSFFWDVGGGILEGDRRFPPTGTDMNLSIRTGPGITYRINEHLDLLAGARYLHISNARQEGEARNPSINAAEAYIGILYKL